MAEYTQRSVLSRPWYWILIGLGLAIIVTFIMLTAATGARGQDQTPSQAQGAPQGQSPLQYGDGSSSSSPLEPGTDIDITYGNDFEGEGSNSKLVDLVATARVTGVNLDATAEALAEDPWADLMLNQGEKLAIVELEITNHAKDELFGFLLAETIVLEDEAGETYTMDIVQVALDREEIPSMSFLEGETTRTVAVFTIPEDRDATSTVVRIKTGSEIDTELNAPIYAYVAVQ